MGRGERETSHEGQRWLLAVTTCVSVCVFLSQVKVQEDEVAQLSSQTSDLQAKVCLCQILYLFPYVFAPNSNS